MKINPFVLNNANMVDIRPTKEVYPVKLICEGHKFIEEIQIPNDYYINIKMKGKWVMIHLPEEKYLERI